MELIESFPDSLAFPLRPAQSASTGVDAGGIMRRRALLAGLMAGLLAAVGALVGVVAAQSAYAATTQQTFLTFYGWWDNTPPGGDIAFPKIHNTAGGKGTFADPITFATATHELAPGTKGGGPPVKKYFIQ